MAHISEAARAMILKSIREKGWGNSARRQMNEFLPLVLGGMESGLISVEDNDYYDTDYKLVGTVVRFRNDKNNDFFIADEVAQDYIASRTIAEIAADITTQLISYYQFDKGQTIKRGMKYIAILKGEK